MITINDLRFNYGKKTIFEDTSFNMELGKIYGLPSKSPLAILMENTKSVQNRTVVSGNGHFFLFQNCYVFDN